MKKDMIEGIPVELISIDEDSGEVCIGDECFKIKIEKGAITFEYNPGSKMCSVEMKKVAKKFMNRLTSGDKPNVRFRKLYD